MKDPTRRVVITGMGVLAPNGNSLEAFWRNTLDGVSGIGRITRFTVEDYPVTVAGEIENFRLETFLPPWAKVKEKRLATQSQYGVAAAHMAIRHAGLDQIMLREREPLSFYLGICTSDVLVIENSTRVLLEKGPKQLSPNAMGSSQPHAVVSAVVESLQVRSRTTTYSSACPSGLEAIGNGMREIQAGKSQLVICGGVDAPVTPLSMACFHRTGMILSNSDHPETSGCPFDVRRKGGVMSEGAGIFVLESLASALSRGAEPLAEIVGMGKRTDAYDEPGAAGLTGSMRDALDDAGFIPADIDYINAHGPSHPKIDICETNCIKKVFGAKAYKIPVSSIKGVVGNPLAAAGGLQVAASVMALREGLVPPTAHYEVPDPECDLNYVPNRPMRASLRNALINLHGIGGANVSLIVQRLQP